MTVLDWLLDSDPSIRWQVMRDLTNEPDEVIAEEQARVATEGWGARLLALQAHNGQWGGGSYHPYWTSTTYTLLTLRDLGVDPNSEQARRAIKLVRDNVQFQWTETDFKPFFEGEAETCINGMVVALGSYFGEPSTSLVERLLGEQLVDGGWNCWAGEAWPGEESTRSSFNTMISVLEGLLEYEKSVAPDPEVTKARVQGHEYLLERRLFRRLSTGEVIEPEWPKTSDFTRFSFPPWYFYDVLRGLDYLRAAGVDPEPRIDEAIELLVSRRDADGRWPLENSHPGEVHLEMEAGDNQPSRWNTLRALRVLKWWER